MLAKAQPPVHAEDSMEAFASQERSKRFGHWVDQSSAALQTGRTVCSLLQQGPFLARADADGATRPVLLAQPLHKPSDPLLACTLDWCVQLLMEDGFCCAGSRRLCRHARPLNNRAPCHNMQPQRG